MTTPIEFQGALVGAVNRRKGVIQSSDQQADEVVINAEVPLNNMARAPRVRRGGDLCMPCAFLTACCFAFVFSPSPSLGTPLSCGP